MEAQITADNIKKLMDVFYAKVRKDKDLGSVFNPIVGESDEAWEKHKAKIATFWQRMMLGEGDYSGHPLRAHLDLPPFPREFFSVWLKLFEESLQQIYTQEIAQEFLTTARGIAERFQYALYEMPHSK